MSGLGRAFASRKKLPFSVDFFVRRTGPSARSRSKALPAMAEVLGDLRYAAGLGGVVHRAEDLVDIPLIFDLPKILHDRLLVIK